MDIDLLQNKVTISLSKANYEAYQGLRNDQTLHSTLNSMVIIPALVSVLESVKRAAGSADDLATFESRRWYSVLARKLKELGIEPTKPDSFEAHSTPALAHRLIGQPLTDSFNTLRSYGEESVTGNN